MEGAIKLTRTYRTIDEGKFTGTAIVFSNTKLLFLWDGKISFMRGGTFYYPDNWEEL